MPAVLYGFTSISNKASTEAGISVGYYLIFVGIAIVAIGAVFTQLMPGSGDSDADKN